MASMKQMIAVKKISDFIRNSNGTKTMPMGKILEESGYAPEVCRKPKMVTGSKGFQEQMRQELGDSNDLVFSQHLFLITQHSNLPVKSKAIDMYYKMTGAYSKRKLLPDQDKKIGELLDQLAEVMK